MFQGKTTKPNRAVAPRNWSNYCIKTTIFRPLQFQQLEERYCPAFTLTHGGGVLTFEGTAGADTLTDIRIAGSVFPLGNTIWFETDGVYTNSGIQWPIAGFPTVGIGINGYAGSDVVDFRGATFVGFPLPGPFFDFMIFAGGEDNDDFWPPPAGGIVALPGPGATYSDANIRFYGGLAIDTLTGSVDPEYFQGHEGNDVATDTGGNDIFLGGPDDDKLHAGPGNDVLDGNDGTDELWGEDDDDDITGGDGYDQIKGGKGDDDIFTGPGLGAHASGEDDDDTISGSLRSYPKSAVGVSSIDRPYCCLLKTQGAQDGRRGTEAVSQ